MNKDTHPLFLDALFKSVPGVEFVAEWMRRRGNVVEVPPVVGVERHQDWRKGSDKGDIILLKDLHGIERNARCEVKHLSVNFTSARDFPYRPHFIVNSKGSHDRANPKPISYTILSHDRRALAVVMTASEKRWYVEDRMDPMTDEVKPFYFANLRRDVKFFQVDEA